MQEHIVALLVVYEKYVIQRTSLHFKHCGCIDGLARCPRVADRRTISLQLPLLLCLVHFCIPLNVYAPRTISPTLLAGFTELAEARDARAAEEQVRMSPAGTCTHVDTRVCGTMNYVDTDGMRC